MIAAVCLGACASGGRMARVLPAPNPNGCYAVVFEREAFRGEAEMLNGPGRWPRLDALGREDSSGWSRRIRSLQLGERTSVIASTEPDFRGQIMRLSRTRDYASLEAPFAAKLQSLEVTCNAVSTAVTHPPEAVTILSDRR